MNIDHTIAFFSSNTRPMQSYFAAQFPHAAQYEHEIQKYSPDAISNREHITIISAFTASQWTAERIDWFPALQYIVNRSTGYDNIDLEHCRARGISVYNVPHYGSVTVAEHAFALIMALSRRVSYSASIVKRDHDFASRGHESIRGFDLAGKTIGVVGTGSIGRHVIAIAHGFGMRITAHDIHPDDTLTRDYGVTWVESLHELLHTSDIITLHVPYIPETHHLINESHLETIKPGAILINTSRGEIIDTHTLVRALENNTLAAAGLDVLEEEPNFAPNSAKASPIQKLNHTLVGMDNVLVTPHNAFNTHEAITRIWETTTENIHHIQTEPSRDHENRVI